MINTLGWRRAIIAILASFGLGLAGCGPLGGRPESTTCLQPVTGAKLSSPFDKGPPFADPRVTNLAHHLQAIGPPMAGVGYDHDRWLNLAALEHDLVAWTKRNPTWTVLDGQTLRPRWGAKSPPAGMTWTASTKRFYAIEVGKRVRVNALRISDGRADWCTTLAGPARNDQVATALTPTGTTSSDGLIVATPSRTGATLTKLSGNNGKPSWQATLAALPDSIISPDEQTLVVGGMDFGTAFDPAEIARAKPAQLLAFRPNDGTPKWTWTAPQPGTLRILGADRGAVLIALVTPNRVFVSRINSEGVARTLFSLPEQDLQATVRGTLLITREKSPHERLTGRDAATGRIRWQQPVPRQPQYFPYGYDLASAPSVDVKHLLLGTTEALVVLNTHTGQHRSYPLPTDGINTTYWPYQVVLTGDGRSTGVVTNTGAVVTSGQPHP